MKTLNEILDERLILESILSEGQEQPDMVNIFKELESIHSKLFPKSWQSVYFVDPNLRIPKDTILFRSTLTNKWNQGFKENDPMDAIFTIQSIGDNKYQATLAKGKYMRTKTSFTKNQLPFRKVKGDSQTIIKKISEWESKRKNMFDENKGNITLD